MTATVRRAVAADAEALYAICLQTADGGEDATALYSDPRLPGYVWSAAYGALEPDFAFILEDDGRPVGYVIGTPDTEAFFRRLDREWWPWVRERVRGLAPSRPSDEGVLARIAAPETCDPWVQAHYPAHLHINILPGAQASGWGRRLIDTELDALRAHGVAGVHLGVSPKNHRAMGFYRHLGFEDISRDGHVLFGMNLRP